MLAAGFIPTGMVKLLGQRFTTIPVDNPIGAFFEAMYQTGQFWRFIGISQVVAGILLLVPPVAHLGALLFLPIVACIAVITVALEFGNTEIVASAMLLAVLYLLLWDYDRIRSILTKTPIETPGRIPSLRLDRWECAGFAVFTAALLAFFLRARGFMPTWVGLALPMAVGTVAGLATLIRFAVVAKEERRLNFNHRPTGRARSAGGGTRTRMGLLPGDFKSPVYADFTTPARGPAIVSSHRGPRPPARRRAARSGSGRQGPG